MLPFQRQPSIVPANVQVDLSLVSCRFRVGLGLGRCSSVTFYTPNCPLASNTCSTCALTGEGTNRERILCWLFMLTSFLNETSWLPVPPFNPAQQSGWFDSFCRPRRLRRDGLGRFCQVARPGGVSKVTPHPWFLVFSRAAETKWISGHNFTKQTTASLQGDQAEVAQAEHVYQK